MNVQHEEPAAATSSHPVITFPSVFAATHHAPTPDTQGQGIISPSGAVPYPSYPRPHDYSAWTQANGNHQSPAGPHALSQPAILYKAYYRDPSAVNSVQQRQDYGHYPPPYRDELQWQQPYTGPFDLSQQNYFTLPRTGADENPSAVGGTPGSTISGVGPPQHGALDTRSSSSCI